MRWIHSYCLGLILWLPVTTMAQRVIYSESINSRSSVQVQVIGKSENYYWIEKQQRQKSKSRHNPDVLTEIQSFGLYDAKLNLVFEEPPIRIQDIRKQWLLATNKGLDQIIISGTEGKTKIICNRYLTDGNSSSKQIDSLPYYANASAFLLVRSEDQSKILLAAFDNTNPEFTRLNAFLFDQDWNPIYHQTISHIQIAQPCIQDEEIGFPAESFDNLPIKLANNGEWLMASPSRISQNFSLFHVCPNGNDYYFREIPISHFYKMEDIAMSINNDKQEMSVGLLSAYLNTSLKNVQIYNYSMTQGRFDFDTSYHFNTEARDIRSKNLSHESFLAVPGGGYMLLKEYGDPLELNKPSIPFVNNWETAYMLANYNESGMNNRKAKEGYTLNRGLSPIPFVRNRGDLNLFYFPAVSKDSTWSGIMEMEQHAEKNNPDLSYLLVPVRNKLYIVYNSQNGFTDPMATTTTLNISGQDTGDALIFWKMNRMLNFQNARRISAAEVSVPYMNNQPSGFAIVRLY